MWVFELCGLYQWNFILEWFSFLMIFYLTEYDDNQFNCWGPSHFPFLLLLLNLKILKISWNGGLVMFCAGGRPLYHCFVNCRVEPSHLNKLFGVQFLHQILELFSCFAFFIDLYKMVSNSELCLLKCISNTLMPCCLGLQVEASSSSCPSPELIQCLHFLDNLS